MLFPCHNVLVKLSVLSKRYLGITKTCLGTALAAVIGSFASMSSVAQEFPSHVLTIIVPYSVGGATDVLARIIAPELAARLGQDVIVDNKTGAAGMIGARMVSSSKPDGHTLLLTDSSLAGNAAVYPDRRKTLSDLTSVGLVATSPYAISVANKLPVRSLQDLIDLSKAQPGKLTYGSGGLVSSTHLAAEWFKSLSKVDMLHIPYRGGGAALTAMAGGEIDVTFMTVPSLLPFVNSGRVRTLAVTSTSRIAELPGVPTTKEVGLSQMVGINWNALFISSKTPRPIADKLNQELRFVLNMPEIKKKLSQLGLEPAADSIEEANLEITKEVKRWSGIVKAANIKLE